jgi:transposase
MANFRDGSNEQGMFIAVSSKEQIIPGTIEYAINDILANHVDTSKLEKKFSNDGIGRKAYNPKTLLKIILRAYSKGIISSRKIERACKQNILFMAISSCAQPDHSTIAAFVSSMNEEVKAIFNSVLLRCSEPDLIGGEVFANIPVHKGMNLFVNRYYSINYFLLYVQ